ncbi:uncharacterized protein EV422DRAFT_525926 [Fimicolochytrium jonesii]|uniref:uncharacterized protein n=1 Tax=Fimicolochytrium jonesii TaxID=1396493 RepID=UPI0022FDDD5E|nr:uncharacterized protein EV422DRAFT_525926 [Fimicolochytrium jonesii]KAI8822164.1 hypothetical protein EV422DRAFT_525926 [Fimicolochytrium jonesii]
MASALLMASLLSFAHLLSITFAFLAESAWSLGICPTGLGPVATALNTSLNSLNATTPHSALSRHSPSLRLFGSFLG